MAVSNYDTIFLKTDIIKIYNIIIDDSLSLDEKMTNILKIGPKTKLLYALNNDTYTNIDKEIEYIKQWCRENDEIFNAGNQYCKSAIRERLELLVKLNELYVNNMLDENHFYELYLKYDCTNKKLKNILLAIQDKNRDILKDDNIRNAYINLDDIMSKVLELTNDTCIENYRFRKRVEKYLDTNNYLVNYNFAEYIINEYINNNYMDPVSFNRKYNIDYKTFVYCTRLIKYINPVLFRKYLEKIEQNEIELYEEYLSKFNNIKDKIIAYKSIGEDMPVLEFFDMCPIKNIYNNIGFTLNKVIKDPVILHEIYGYLDRNKIYNNPININAMIKAKCIYNGIELTETDILNVVKIMKYYDYPLIKKLFNIIMDNYSKGMYNMDEINDNMNDDYDNNKQKSISIDFVQFNNNGEDVLKRIK